MTRGSRKAARQPSHWAIPPATAGPTSDGTIQAVAKAAKTLARSASGIRSDTRTTSAMSRPPSAMPESARAASSTSIEGASPDAICARANNTSENNSGRRGPLWSVQVPATVVAT